LWAPPLGVKKKKEKKKGFHSLEEGVPQEVKKVKEKKKGGGGGREGWTLYERRAAQQCRGCFLAHKGAPQKPKKRRKK
jgi:hypothetical protein